MAKAANVNIRFATNGPVHQATTNGFFAGRKPKVAGKSHLLSGFGVAINQSEKGAVDKVLVGLDFNNDGKYSNLEVMRTNELIMVLSGETDLDNNGTVTEDERRAVAEISRQHGSMKGPDGVLDGRRLAQMGAKLLRSSPNESEFKAGFNQVVGGFTSDGRLLLDSDKLPAPRKSIRHDRFVPGPGTSFKSRRQGKIVHDQLPVFEDPRKVVRFSSSANGTTATSATSSPAPTAATPATAQTATPSPAIPASQQTASPAQPSPAPQSASQSEPGRSFPQSGSASTMRHSSPLSPMENSFWNQGPMVPWMRMLAFQLAGMLNPISFQPFGSPFQPRFF